MSYQLTEDSTSPGLKALNDRIAARSKGEIMIHTTGYMQVSPESKENAEAVKKLKAFADCSDRNKNNTASSNQLGVYTRPHGDVCPTCGHCPHCGRGGYQTHPFYPPYTTPYWGQPYLGGTSGLMQTSDNISWSKSSE